ncbi:competence/damage-inducible protein A [Methylobrevis pamukkalensis]|uniref:Nicotinamide-nucleotide amidohydrolase PncC n=1 Tax=Methylobrevis pamukkalensis TaxID=1439726 RepID=A0A1E3H2Y5_9HYPH|nr:molybdopterin-binding protein [Methylobrevis pamukkalensis]ODN70672.1 Nicotinamide-nucleotide amidohydrolase PncC [Methylobrevis pamukkalensis]
MNAEGAAADGAVTAAVLVIGDEILSGRTRDTNSGTIAARLTELGIDLLEIRVVPDDMDRIVGAVNELRARHTYLFTTGGIGPTHDDITADAIAAAFGVTIDIDERARAILSTHYARPEDLTPARLRMARIPAGADLIDNPVSKAPGFRLGNVHVMAGVPKIMEAMLEAITPTLTTGRVIVSETIDCPFGEGWIAEPLGAIQALHPDVTIGSYPRFSAAGFSTRLVVRSRDGDALARAAAAVRAMLAQVAGARGVAAPDHTDII